MKSLFAYRFLKTTHELTSLATKQKRGFVFPVEVLIFIALFLVINLLSQFPMIFLGIVAGLLGQTDRLTDFFSGPAGNLINTLLVLIVIVLYMVYCTQLEKRSLRSMGFRRQGFVRDYLKGLLIGFLAISAVVLLGVASGGFRFEGVNAPDVIPGVLLYLLFFIVQGMEEEVICRGYFMISLSRRSPLWASVLLNSLLFALLHLLNPGIGAMPIINLILFGVFASLYMLRTGNIWGVGAIHTIWNFAQGNLYGFEVSGTGKLPTILRFSQTGSPWINGGDFGPEGGLSVTLVYLAAIALVLFLPEKKNHDRLVSVKE